MKRIDSLVVIEGIMQAVPAEIDDYMDAACKRYSELYPGFEVARFTLDLNEDVDQQIDRTIVFLEGLRKRIKEESRA